MISQTMEDFAAALLVVRHEAESASGMEQASAMRTARLAEAVFGLLDRARLGRPHTAVSIEPAFDVPERLAA